MISFDAETVTGTTGSGDEGGSGGAAGWKTGGIPDEGSSTEVVSIGSLG